MIFYTVTVYMAALIFLAGLTWRVTCWLRNSIQPDLRHNNTAKRFLAAMQGIFEALAGINILKLLRSIVIDVVLQARIFKASKLRWCMHLCIYAGFTALFLMHALDDFVSAQLFTDYYPTLNPFRFLRNLFGLLVLAGLIVAAYHRLFSGKRRLINRRMDLSILVMLAVIIITGILTEAFQMVSYDYYSIMVDDYAGLDEQEGRSLESYWVESFGIISPNVKAPLDDEVLAEGRALHRDYCAVCHVSPQWAFMSFPSAKAIRPVAAGWRWIDLSEILWYLHVFSSLALLACIPFTKMFHLFASSLSMMTRAVAVCAPSNPLNRETRQMMELDACTHCGECSLHCSVGPAFEWMGNQKILPSEKIQTLKAFVSGKPLASSELNSLREAICFCTHCGRCTQVCPSGIALRDLWMNASERFLQQGDPLPTLLSQFAWPLSLDRSADAKASVLAPVIEKSKAKISARFPQVKRTQALVPLPGQFDRTDPNYTRLILSETMVNCYDCRTCTNVCPVVNHYEAPELALDLLPHQITRSMGLGLSALVLGSRMLWSCVSCYQCQEHCPQGVHITGLLYVLKNQAIAAMSEEAFDKKRQQTDLHPFASSQPINTFGPLGSERIS